MREMSDKMQKSFFIFILTLSCMLTSIPLTATRPSMGEVAQSRCHKVMDKLEEAFATLTSQQIAEMMKMPRGVRMIDGHVLRYLIQRDPKADQNELYDIIMQMETGVSQCRYFCIFNPNNNSNKESYVLLDTSHGHNSLADYSNLSPRNKFKKFCELFEVDEYYAEQAKFFLAETEKEKKLNKAKKRDIIFIRLFAQYWYVFVLLGILEFLLTDGRKLRKEALPVKLYALGLIVTCSLIGLSFATNHYTGTPLPSLRNYSNLVPGSYPNEIHLIGDIITFTSFAWWFVSIAFVFFASRYQYSILIPLAFVVGAPMSLALSEIPFGGMLSLAFPAFGILMLVVYNIYMKKFYLKP